MAFHIPPKCSWQPAAISSELTERGLCASVAGNDVLITLPREQQTIAARCLSRFFRRHQPVLRIQHNPHRFLINVDIMWDPLRHQKVFDNCYDAIDHAMIAQGYLEACADYTERRLATLYCGANHYLLLKFDQIDELRREMEKLVMNREYEMAARTRDAERRLCIEIDAILFEAWVDR
jgi:hypothetical protein